MDSPPKRMTRARAAAKANEPGMKTTRIVTGASRARSGSTATASTQSAAAKRKTRSDENDDGDDGLNTSRRVAPARTKKTTNAIDGTSTTETSVKPVRRTAARSSVSATTTSLSRTRGRQPKPSLDDGRDADNASGVKITRNRAGTISKRGDEKTKPTTGKTVTFKDSGKENIEPVAKAKDHSSAGGLRGRPVRRGAAASSTPAAAVEGTGAKNISRIGAKKPLSPKKVTQIPVCKDRDSSEDELAGVDESKSSRNRSDRPSASVVSEPREDKASFSVHNGDSETTAVTELRAPPAPVTFGSPPRRPPTSPSKESLKSPAKRAGGIQLPGSPVKRTTHALAENNLETSSSKPALLQSPAKRPQSPIKGLTMPSATTGVAQSSQPSIKGAMLQSPAKRAMPGRKQPATTHMEDTSNPDQSPKMKPLIVSVSPSSGRPSERLLAEDRRAYGDSDPFVGPIESPILTGRMSAVMPRHDDPALCENKSDSEIGLNGDYRLFQESLVVEKTIELSHAGDVLAISSPSPRMTASASLRDVSKDNVSAEATVAHTEHSGDWRLQTPQPQGQSPSIVVDEMFQLRENDLDPCYDIGSDFESEEESSPSKQYSTAKRSCDARHSICVLSSGERRSTLGLTSLAEQFGAWPAASPAKVPAISAPGAADAEIGDTITPHRENADQAEETPMNSTYFDDEIMVQGSDQFYDQHDLTRDGASNISVLCTNDIEMTDEDTALAQEAKDMSSQPQTQAGANPGHNSNEDILSEASEEYGDENELPVDAALNTSGSSDSPSTPSRPLQQRTFYTTTKVPLKPADDSADPVRRRSFSSSRTLSNSGSTLPRSATVISYSPSKQRKRKSNASTKNMPSTPSRVDEWSTIGTPGRTPRRDIKSDLLCGAVVFVDVHTTEGADASSIFVELLTQMGAKCVKSWNWNPSSPTTSDRSTNRVGITHVVFKDGGKRTMEKVRETGGVVQCVGVSWVLDCERENEWLDEAPYYIDTALVPRGGSRRRKSMEPKTIANLNGTIVSSPNRASKSPTTPRNRRESTLWMHTPSDQGDPDGDYGDDDLEWSCSLLTPVPKTPAPEAIAKYAAELPETPPGDDTTYASPSKQSCLTKTCPPKSNKYRELGDGVLSRDKDEQVVMRLMAARRKSLQFAPKIASPLSKAWK